MKRIVILAAPLFVVLGALWLGKFLWQKNSANALSAFDTTAPGGAAGVVDLSHLAELPPPVERFLRRSLHDGQPLISSVRAQQIGQFRTGDNPETGWRRFEAVQVYDTSPPGFIWSAEITVAPLVTVFARDAFVNGHGSMRVSLLGWIDVINEGQKAELDQGALQRYLAEAVWFPTALLPGQGVVWGAIDDDSAEATVVVDGVTATLTFHFDDLGDVIKVSTPARYRQVDNGYRLQPWQVRLTDHAERNGMRMPLSGEVAWLIDGREYPYWRGRISTVVHRFAGPTPDG